MKCNKTCCENCCTCSTTQMSLTTSHDLERLQMRLECLKLASRFTDPNGDGVYAIELANRYYDYLTK